MTSMATGSATFGKWTMTVGRPRPGMIKGDTDETDQHLTPRRIDRGCMPARNIAACSQSSVQKNLPPQPRPSSV